MLTVGTAGPGAASQQRKVHGLRQKTARPSVVTRAWIDEILSVSAHHAYQKNGHELGYFQ
jgi:hypothetical protein